MTKKAINLRTNEHLKDKLTDEVSVSYPRQSNFVLVQIANNSAMWLTKLEYMTLKCNYLDNPVELAQQLIKLVQTKQSQNEEY